MGKPSISDPSTKCLLLKQVLSRERVSFERLSGRKIVLDEVVEPLFQPESSAAQKVVSVEPTSVEEEVNDDDHEASDQVTIEPRRPTRMRTWYGNPVLEVMLLDNDEPTSYGEAMMGPDSEKWFEAMKSEMGSM